MAYTVKIRPGAARDVRRLPSNTQDDIIAAIRKLSTDPRPTGCKKLEGSKDGYRIRVGEYRVIYRVVDGDDPVVVVGRAQHRREAYRGLPDLLKQM